MSSSSLSRITTISITSSMLRTSSSPLCSLNTNISNMVAFNSSLNLSQLSCNTANNSFSQDMKIRMPLHLCQARKHDLILWYAICACDPFFRAILAPLYCIRHDCVNTLMFSIYWQGDVSQSSMQGRYPVERSHMGGDSPANPMLQQSVNSIRASVMQVLICYQKEICSNFRLLFR